MCTIHQSTKLLVDAFSGNINGCMRRINRVAAGDADGEEVEEVQSYLQGLKKIIVCDIENMECMCINVRTAPAVTLCTHICRRSFKSTM